MLNQSDQWVRSGPISVADDASGAFARFLIATQYNALPSHVVEATKQSILDTIAVMFAGSSAASAKGIVRLVDHWGGRPEASVIGHRLSLPAVSAAFANGAFAHQYDFDDTHDAGVVHPTANSLAAGLAVAETLETFSGADLIAAIAAANEIVCRLGLAITGNLFDYPWTRPPVLGTFGAAAVSAKVLGLDEEETRSTFGLTLHQACNTLECLYAPGSEVRGLRDGFSVRNGLTAAYMAREGIVGDHSAFEGRFGLFNAFFRGDYRREPLLTDLGTVYEGANVSIKPWPSARETHATIHAVLSLRNKESIEPASIERVTLTVGAANLEFCEPGAERRAPRRRMDALSSLPFAVAVALKHGSVSLRSYSESAIRDDDVLALAQKVDWVLDTSIQEGTIEGGRVQIKLKDGRQLEAKARHAFGHPGQPLPLDVKRAKLGDCVAMMDQPLSDTELRRIVDAVESLERISVAELSATLKAGRI